MMSKKDLENLIKVRVAQGQNNEIDVVVQEIMFEADRYFTAVTVEEILIDLATMPLNWFGKPMWRTIQHMIAKKYPNDGADD